MWLCWLMVDGSYWGISVWVVAKEGSRSRQDNEISHRDKLVVDMLLTLLSAVWDLSPALGIGSVLGGEGGGCVPREKQGSGLHPGPWNVPSYFSSLHCDLRSWTGSLTDKDSKMLRLCLLTGQREVVFICLEDKGKMTFFKSPTFKESLPRLLSS